MKLLRFFTRLLAYSLLLALAIAILQEYTTLIPSGTWGVFGFFVAVSFLIFALSRFILRSGSSRSLQLLLATLFIRLFLSFGYFVLYVSVSGNSSISFAAVFMILYLLFTVFENYHLVINLRPDSQKDSIGDVQRQ